MKKMQYSAPATDVRTIAMVSMLCASADPGAGSTMPENVITFEQGTLGSSLYAD